MDQKFNLESAGRLFGVSANAVRARVKKYPEKYRVERDNRGQIWLWLDPEKLPELKPLKAKSETSSLVELKASIEALRMQADLVADAAALRSKLAEVERRLAVAEALAEDRARALDAAERNLSDLRRMLPPSSASAPAVRPWWRFWF